MASGRMALGDAKSGRDVDPMLRPDSRFAFRRPGRQTHGAHRTQGIIFADERIFFNNITCRSATILPCFCYEIANTVGFCTN